MMCMRVKRGVGNTAKPGGFYKDQASFRGAVELIKHRHLIDWTALHTFKICWEDLPLIAKVSSDTKTRILPPFVDESYSSCVDEIAQSNGLATLNFRPSGTAQSLATEQQSSSGTAQPLVTKHMTPKSRKQVTEKVSPRKVMPHSGVGRMKPAFDEAKNSADKATGCKAPWLVHEALAKSPYKLSSRS
jgi:hypothetical protein